MKRTIWLLALAGVVFAYGAVNAQSSPCCSRAPAGATAPAANGGEDVGGMQCSPTLAAGFADCLAAGNNDLQKQIDCAAGRGSSGCSENSGSCIGGTGDWRQSGAPTGCVCVAAGPNGWNCFVRAPQGPPGWGVAAPATPQQCTEAAVLGCKRARALR